MRCSCASPCPMLHALAFPDRQCVHLFWDWTSDFAHCTCIYSCACTSEKQILGDAFKLRSMRAAGLTSQGRIYITMPTKGWAHAVEDKQAESHQLSAVVSWKAVQNLKLCLFTGCLLHSDHTWQFDVLHQDRFVIWWPSHGGHCAFTSMQKCWLAKKNTYIFTHFVGHMLCDVFCWNFFCV